MQQDQLTRAERVRLEALSQAVAQSPLTHAQRPTLSEILEDAERIEVWLKLGRDH